ncbi:GNAT family N-acetyltransferase [Salmonella enterica subsp. enterica serovar Poona]|nr:GNAT family N-acetyltransferase [Salmonella enterica]ECW9809584.1 GNAT family N-acetyltransferase [Salmonella enterica subsp. enterica serovar Poona]HAF1609333.1 GNAT family N-acetyltransferase [Salmonella enterica]
MEKFKVKIRTARESDIDILIKLRAILLDGDSNATYVSKSEKEKIRWKKSYENWLTTFFQGKSNITANIFVADIEGNVVGCATGIVDSRPPAPDCTNGSCGWVQSVAVLPIWRRKGIAQKMLSNLLCWFTDQNINKVLLEATPESNSLYKKIGFKSSTENLFIYRGKTL